MASFTPDCARIDRKVSETVENILGADLKPKGRAESREYRVFPGSVIWVYWDRAVGIFEVHLGQEAVSAQAVYP